MNKVKKITILLFGFLLILTYACNKNEDIATCNLNEIGLLGEWEIEYRITAGDTSSICCEILSFIEDNNLIDCHGIFEVNTNASNSNGLFEVLSSESEIIFDLGVLHSQEFTIQDNRLYLTRNTNGNEIVEEYIKIN